MSRIGTRQPRSTASATLPNTSREIPLRPWLVIAIRSAWCLCAASMMAGAAGPCQTRVSMGPIPSATSRFFTAARYASASRTASTQSPTTSAPGRILASATHNNTNVHGRPRAIATASGIAASAVLDPSSGIRIRPAFMITVPSRRYGCPGRRRPRRYVATTARASFPLFRLDRDGRALRRRGLGHRHREQAILEGGRHLARIHANGEAHAPGERPVRPLDPVVLLVLVLLLLLLLTPDRHQVLPEGDLDVLLVHPGDFDLGDQAVLGLRDVHARSPVADRRKLVPLALEHPIEHPVHVLLEVRHSGPRCECTHRQNPPAGSSEDSVNAHRQLRCIVGATTRLPAIQRPYSLRASSGAGHGRLDGATAPQHYRADMRDIAVFALGTCIAPRTTCGLSSTLAPRRTT